MTQRVLIVDDDVDILESTALLLRGDGHDVVALESWEGVVEAVRGGRYDALLQDVNMPGLDVTELIREVRRADRRIVVLLFTAASDVEVIAARTGVDGYVQKPFEVDDLMRRVRELGRIRAMVG